MNEKRIAEQLKALLESAVKKTVNGEEKVAVAFSGGLDSSIVAFIARKTCAFSLYTAGAQGCADFKNGASAAELLSLPWIGIEVGKKDVEEAISSVARVAETNSPIHISYLLPLYFVASHCEENVVISGQGADEEFAGYRKYLDVGKENLKDALEKDLREVISSGVKRERNVANMFKKSLRAPFLEQSLVDFALYLPVEYKVKDGKRKHLLREAAKLIGLPDEIVSREKKAAQYGSGMMKLMRIIAKEKGVELNKLSDAILRDV